MAVRTLAETFDLVQDVTKLIGHAHEHGDGDFATDISDIENELAVGDHVPENLSIAQQLTNVKNAYNSFVQSTYQLARVTYAALGRLGGCPNLNDLNLCLDYMQQYMITNSKVIEKQGFTKDTASTISGNGAALCTISSTDLNGDIIDIGHAEDLTLRCTKDYSQGATAGAEEFTIIGEAAGTLPWNEGGSGQGGAYDYAYGQVDADFSADQKRSTTRFNSIGPSSSAGNLVRNGDFETPISGSGSTKLPQWTINSGDTAITQETSDPILGTYSLVADANFEMDHFFTRGRLKPGAFYSIGIKLERKSSADGTLTVKVMDSDEGTTHGTLTQNVASLSNDTPGLVQPVHFFVPLSAEDLKVQVELASNTTGTVKIDDVMVGPTTLIDGYLVSIMDNTTLDASGYAQGRTKYGDEFVIQTSNAKTGLIQHYFVALPSGRYLASDTAASTDLEDPSL